MRLIAEFTIALAATGAVLYFAAPELIREVMRGIFQQLT